MQSSEIIESNYAKAVQGIKKEWLRGPNDEYHKYISALPLHLQITYLITVLHNQVLNGGFHQYFVNGYGQFAYETVKALEAIGALKRANLLQCAITEVNNDGLDNKFFRKALLEKTIDRLFIGDDLFEPLSKLDDSYYEIDDEDISQLLSNYLQNNDSNVDGQLK